jgi:DNA repair exonuclease SbcCD nuclease subunit
MQGTFYFGVVDFLPYGAKIPSDTLASILLHHRMVYPGTKPYPDAPDAGRIDRLAKELGCYDYAIFGDNHHPFIAEAGGCQICNPGCFIPRTIDERESGGHYGVLSESGFVLRKIGFEEDQWADTPTNADENSPSRELDKLVDGLREFARVGSKIDFARVLDEAIAGASAGVKEVVRRAVEYAGE